MRKMILCMLFVLISSISLAVDGNLGNGNGTQQNPYLIEDLDDFNAFCDQPLYWSANTYTRLECQLDLSVAGDYYHAPIAPDTSSAEGFQGTPYEGRFDGNGYMILNLTIDGELSEYGEHYNYVGLFGCVGENAGISNLQLENASIYDVYQYVGGLCGTNAGSLSNCSVTASIEAIAFAGGLCGMNTGLVADSSSAGLVKGSECLGGLCGYSVLGMFSRSYAESTVIGQFEIGGLIGKCEGGFVGKCRTLSSVDGAAYAGGFCGRNVDCMIYDSYSSGSVKGYTGIGGLCGYSLDQSSILFCYSNCSIVGNANVGGISGVNTGTISYSYSAGHIEGTDNVGGLCGINHEQIADCYSVAAVEGHNSVGGLCGYNRDRIYRCYSIGSVTGQIDAGAFVGRILYSEGDTEAGVYDCFWDVEVSGMGMAGDDNHGATGKTTVQMFTQLTFVNAGWTFADSSNTDGWFMPWEGQEYPRFGWQMVAADIVAPYGVNLADFAYLARYWGVTDCLDNNDDCAKADLLRNGQVGIEDLTAFAEEWLGGVY